MVSARDKRQCYIIHIHLRPSPVPNLVMTDGVHSAPATPLTVQLIGEPCPHLTALRYQVNVVQQGRVVRLKQRLQSQFEDLEVKISQGEGKIVCVGVAVSKVSKQRRLAIARRRRQ